jgi:glycolate oxidase FAD binding subunit
MSNSSTNPPVIETLTPADTAAVAEAVRAAGEKRQAVYPVGGGTSFNGSVLASRPGIALSMAKLSRAIDHPADDMTVTVEAGVTVAELNKLLAEKRQWLPVDVAFPDRATVGGAIAANAAGPRRFAYGTMRDYLLGFTAVDGTGAVFSGGGRVVKNAAGYNMCRLMAGSFGTLGIITQATLMVRPLPETAALLACETPDFDLAEKLLASLIRLPVSPVAVELSAGRAHEGNPLFGPLSNGSVGRLCVGFEGSAVEVEWMLGRLREEWSAIGMASPVLMPNLATDKLWRWIAECPADETIHVLPSKLTATIADLLKQSPDVAIQAHAGNGIVHVKRASGNECVAAASTRRQTDEAAVLSPEIRVMQAIKERFDPANVLNPGVLFT